jgi:hypothetical protein
VCGRFIVKAATLAGIEVNSSTADLDDATLIEPVEVTVA